MHSSGKTLALTLLGLCALGLAARPAAAQNLEYQLSGVTFNDGAVAFGFFDFNPTTKAFGSFDITTTDGITDALIGAHYTPGFYAPDAITPGNYDIFQFISNDGKYNFLSLGTNVPAESPGFYTIQTGTVGVGYFSGSGEFASINTAANRVVQTGSLLVTEPAAVPEASTTISFGLLLTLGFGGFVVAARKRKATAV